MFSFCAFEPTNKPAVHRPTEQSGQERHQRRSGSIMAPKEAEKKPMASKAAAAPAKKPAATASASATKKAGGEDTGIEARST